MQPLPWSRRFLRFKGMDSDIYGSAVKNAEEIMAALSSESMLVPLEDATRFLKSVKGVRRDANFLLRKGMFAVPKVLREHKDLMLMVHNTLLKLLKTVDESLEKIGNFMGQKNHVDVKCDLKSWTGLLLVISACHTLCKMYKDGIESFEKIVAARWVPLKALIVHAQRNPDHHWLLKFTGPMNYKTKRSLAMMLFPPVSADGPRIDMVIDRSEVFADSFEFIGKLDAPKLHGGFSVRFKDEEANGSAGLKEWFCLLCKEIFSRQRGLFSPCTYDRSRFFINPASPSDPLHLEYYRFAGRVVALALRHEFQLGITFDQTFILNLAGDDDELEVEHIKDTDPVLFASFTKILEMDDELLDSDALELVFAREVQELGSWRVIEVGWRDEGGMDRHVRSADKEEFVYQVVRSYFVDVLAEKISHFAKGFSDVCSKVKFCALLFRTVGLKNFDRMLRGGGLKIDVDDWKAHIVYDGYTDEDQQIISFWKIVEGMEEEEKEMLLHFWTDIRSLPVEGFSGLDSKLSICNTFDTGECLPLPRSFPSFCLLQLPPYPSMSVMQSKLQFIFQDQLKGGTFTS